MSILMVQDLSQRFLDKQLYQNAGFQVNKEDHLGIIGQNGVGKSTLIKILTGTLQADEGKITWQRHLKIGYLDQYANLTAGMTIFDFLKTAFQELYDAEQKMNQDYADYGVNGDEELLEKAGELQELLEVKEFYDVETKIEQVASGLGIQAIGLDHDVAELSGGQRSKIILAKLLLEKPDMLLLDEPTNYLDTSHIDWLSDYLNDFEGAFIVISHDYEFLERITNCICDIEFGQITKYTGDLKQAMRQKAENKKSYLKAYENQQKQIEKTKAYIRKFKAGTRSTSAKSREKQLDKMEILTPPGNKLKANFGFPYQATSSQIVLLVNDLVIGYDKPLLPALNFSISRGEKAVIKGFNGIGKTTLLRSLLGEIPVLGGEFETAETVRTAYFEQELEWENPRETPLDYLSDQYPELRPKELRQNLARTGTTSEEAVKELRLLSGGEQSKVKLANLMLQSSNLLILDEPTNHLDDDTKAALRKAIQSYEGAVILVTHEEDFYDDTWIDHVIDIEKLLKRK